MAVSGLGPFDRTPLVAPPTAREPLAEPFLAAPVTLPVPVPLAAPQEPPPEIALAGLPELSAPPGFDALRPLPPPPPAQDESAETVPATPPTPAVDQPGAVRRIEVPGSPLEQAMRALSGGNRSPRFVVGDLGSGSMGSVTEARSLPRSPANTGSNLELLTDTRGVDFQPYLVQVLASVRRNWRVVIPESVRLGQRGRVTIQLAVETSGRISKLVIASSSRFDPLDRAAVAAITASEPFPPLPREFTGEEARLQFNFQYNWQR